MILLGLISSNSPNISSMTVAGFNNTSTSQVGLSAVAQCEKIFPDGCVDLPSGTNIAVYVTSNTNGLGIIQSLSGYLYDA
jgi:hypothetical protein